MPVILAGVAMGFINALGNLGGFVGPYVGGWLQDLAGGSFLTTSFFLAAACSPRGWSRSPCAVAVIVPSTRWRGPVRHGRSGYRNKDGDGRGPVTSAPGGKQP